MWWLIDTASQLDGHLVGSLTHEYLRLDGIQVHGVGFWHLLLERVRRDWPATPSADALGDAVAEVWASWDADAPLRAGTIEELGEGPDDGVYGLWWD